MAVTCPSCGCIYEGRHVDSGLCLNCAVECKAVAVEHVAWDHAEHGPHTLLSHDDGRWAGCRAGECEPLYRAASEGSGAVHGERQPAPSDSAQSHKVFADSEHSRCPACDTELPIWPESDVPA